MVRHGADPPLILRLVEELLALELRAEEANALPGFRMLTLVLGVNPINMGRVERSPANILRAVVELLPGGNLVTRALDAYGIFDRAGGSVPGTRIDGSLWSPWV